MYNNLDFRASCGKLFYLAEIKVSDQPFSIHIELQHFFIVSMTLLYFYDSISDTFIRVITSQPAGSCSQ